MGESVLPAGANPLDTLAQRGRKCVQGACRTVDILGGAARDRENAHIDFCGLVDLLIPGDSGVLAMIAAYFDESERNDGTFAVAGYCYFPPQAKKLDREWGRILEGRTFRASLMNARRGDFEGATREWLYTAYRDLVDSILKHAAFGVAISCNQQDVTRAWPAYDGFRTAYAVCSHLCMTTMRMWLESRGLGDQIAYFFEAGHKSQGEASNYFNWITATPELRRQYRYHSHSFIPKEGCIALGTADLLVWECAKHVGECRHKAGAAQEHNMRKSLRALLESGKVQHHHKHLTGEELVRYFATVEEMAERIKLRT